MGFGSYDESEQEKQEVDTDEIEDSDGVKTEEAKHRGKVEYEVGDTDELLDKLQEIKD